VNLVYDFLFIVGMLFTSIYIYILLKSKELNLSKYILIIFFGIIILVLLESYAYIHQVEWLKYISFTFVYGSKLIIGPLLIVYIQSLFLEDKKVAKNNRLLLVPYFLFSLIISAPYAIARLFKEHFTSHIYIIENYSQYIRISLDIVLLLFLYQAFNQFKKYRKIQKCNYSNVEDNNFIWVRYLLISVAIIISIDFLITLTQVLFNAFPIRSQNIIMSLVSLCIIVGAYYGINQSKVLVPYFLLENGNILIDNKVLTIEEKNENTKLESILHQLMQEQKPYLDEELTLSKLASYLNTTDKKLSKLLNQHINTTFYNFVNTFRLKEFKRRVQDDSFKNITIEGIANDCGFKSKASFYKLFNKETGLSPSEYKKSLK